MGVAIVPEMALPSDLAGLHVLHLTPSVMWGLAFAVPSLEAASPGVRIFWQQAKSWAKSQDFLASTL